ncbi:LOG family protein [Cellulomonas composti]|uniref:Rossmann fold nucleotide-binding protein n=1 Tax=Cellulomonas composti TaxID=266130 RepID=A0A511JDG5_9CELL|nr:LOG family protein [Cellulomonas composti]GEL95986.1 hypothetical protein CCO02nite_26440 [Cellulomonas composti]
MTRQTIELESLAELDDHLAETLHRLGRPSLRGAMVQSVDLSGRSSVLAECDVAGAVLLGCALADDVESELRARGALVFPMLPDLPFNPYRSTLYDADALFGDGPYAQSLDGIVYAWSREWRTTRDLRGSLAGTLHDHSITDALDDLMLGIEPARVVGVMGGHDVHRSTPAFADAARLGRDLTRAGYTVLTGGGPGAMEAVNLGAYLSGFDDDALDDPQRGALALLSAAPTFAGPGGIDAWVDAARAVRRAYPPARAGRSVGIPTWFYGHEPPNLFATDIAKYFINSVREDTLLHRCRGGIVVLPGAAGTVQEIFQASTENYYAAQRALVAPLVLVGTEQWMTNLPVWPLLTALGAGRTMGERLHLVADVTAVLPTLTSVR